MSTERRSHRRNSSQHEVRPKKLPPTDNIDANATRPRQTHKAHNASADILAQVQASTSTTTKKNVVIQSIDETDDAERMFNFGRRVRKSKQQSCLDEIPEARGTNKRKARNNSTSHGQSKYTNSTISHNNLPNYCQQNGSTSTSKKPARVARTTTKHYESLREVVATLQIQMNSLQNKSKAMEEQNRQLFKQLSTVDKNIKVARFVQQQTASILQQANKVCQANAKSLHLIESRRHLKSVSSSDKENANPKSHHAVQKPPLQPSSVCLNMVEGIKKKMLRA